MAALNLLVGLACGLRLTLLAFVLVMMAVLAAVAVLLAFGEASLIAVIGDVALAALCLQAGYAAGVVVRSRIG